MGVYSDEDYFRGYNDALANVRRQLFDAGSEHFGWTTSDKDPIISDVINHVRTLPIADQTWHVLSEQQKMWLKHTDSQRRTSYLSHEEVKAREAKELEDLGLLTIEFDYRHGRSYTIYATPAGRTLAKKHNG